MTNRPRNSGFRMSIFYQTILVGSNLVLAAAVSYYVLKSVPLTVFAAKGGIAAATGDELPAVALETLDASVKRLTLTLQRFNTTSLQFKYLQTEIDRLGVLDQTLSKRIKLEESKTRGAQTGDAAKGVKQLQSIQGQVREELKHHRESMVRLVEGLERELDAVALATKAVEKGPEGSEASTTGESEQESEPVETPLGKPQE